VVKFEQGLSLVEKVSYLAIETGFKSFATRNDVEWKLQKKSAIL
jgi:hypothetical protein